MQAVTPTPSSLLMRPRDLETGPGPVIPLVAWNAIQRYAASGAKLPASSSFVEADAAFRAIRAHCRTWNETLAARVIQTIADLRDFANDTPARFAALRGLLKETAATTSETLRAQLRDMRQAIDRTEANAEDVSRQIAQFSRDCGADAATVRRLLNVLQPRFDARQKELVGQLASIAGKEREVAALARQLQAGGLGTHAAELKRRSAQLSTEIAGARVILNAQSAIFSPVQSVLDALLPLEPQLGAVLGPLQRTNGVWQALASDLKSIEDHLSTEPSNDSLLLELDLEAAESEWGLVKTAADAFIVSARSS